MKWILNKKGLNGAKGDDGVIGPNGEQGSKGVIGEFGNLGDKGTLGVQGLKVYFKFRSMWYLTISF